MSANSYKLPNSTEARYVIQAVSQGKTPTFKKLNPSQVLRIKNRRKAAKKWPKYLLVMAVYNHVGNINLTPEQTRRAIHWIFGIRVSSQAIYRARYKLRKAKRMTPHDTTARMI